MYLSRDLATTRAEIARLLQMTPAAPDDVVDIVSGEGFGNRFPFGEWR